MFLGKPGATPLRSKPQQVQTPPKSEETTISSYKHGAKVSGKFFTIIRKIASKLSSTYTSSGTLICFCRKYEYSNWITRQIFMTKPT